METPLLVICGKEVEVLDVQEWLHQEELMVLNATKVDHVADAADMVFLMSLLGGSR